MTDNRTTELRRCKRCGEKPQVLKRDGRAAHACRVLDRELRMTVDEWNAENEDATDVLRCMLDERGVEYEAYRDIKNRRITKWRTYHGAFVFFAVEKEGKLFVETTSDTEHSAICTPEQAIAATLGSEQHPYELRITGDGSDWGEIMRDAYDDLMASASESCTPGEIADLEAHIAATLGNRTCEWLLEHSGTLYDKWRCSECGYEYVESRTDGGATELDPRFCPNCGKAVKR